MVTTFVSIIVFIAVSVLFGSLWFAVCVWNPVWKVRDFRVLLIAIPLSFLVMYGVLGDPPSPRAFEPPAPTPEAAPQKTVVKKKHKKKVVKKEEDEQSSDDSEPKVRYFDVNRNEVVPDQSDGGNHD